MVDDLQKNMLPLNISRKSQRNKSLASLFSPTTADDFHRVSHYQTFTESHNQNQSIELDFRSPVAVVLLKMYLLSMMYRRAQEK